MPKIAEAMVPRTTTDIVYDSLFNEIITLELLPGAKISEAEVAGRLGVSRQPVRDAFNRLGNAGLLTIRPQRATEVRRFSIERIENTRFVRRAVELEVISEACRVWDAERADKLEANLSEQRRAIGSGSTARFHELDYNFHRLICELSGHPLAFETIQECKRPVDRLCLLSLGHYEEVAAILEEHERIANALSRGSLTEARDMVHRHMSRLDNTIAEIHEAHSEYFE